MVVIFTPMLILSLGFTCDIYSPKDISNYIRCYGRSLVIKKTNMLSHFLHVCYIGYLQSDILLTCL